MLVDLNITGKRVVVIGGGSESELKAFKLIDAGASITVLAENFTRNLERLASSKKLRLVRTSNLSIDAMKAISKLKPLAIFVASADKTTDRRVAEKARSAGVMVCVTDTPQLNDFNMPAIAKLGDIRVAVVTGGKSPAMSGIIRKRVEKMITHQDILQVKLQGYLRQKSSIRLRDSSVRKQFVYETIKDRNIRDLLRQNRYADAKRLALKKLLTKAGTAA